MYKINNFPKDVFVVLGKDGKFIDVCDNFKSALGRGMVYLKDNVLNIPENADVNEYVSNVLEDYSNLEMICCMNIDFVCDYKSTFETKNKLITIIHKVV